MRNRRNSVMLELNGERRQLDDWAERLGIHRDAIRGRLRLGWSVESALTTPSKPRGSVKAAKVRHKKGVIHDESRRLPPDSMGRKRYIDKDGRNIRVKVGIDHPLATSNGWALERRVVVYESGVDLGPLDRVFHLDRNRLNNNPSNLAVKRRGEGYPWAKKDYGPPPLCACGCGRATSASGNGRFRKYIDGHRPSWRTIQDEFSNLPVSRQRIFQLRWKKAGLCGQCRKPLGRYKHYCDACREKSLAHRKAKYHNDPAFRARVLKSASRWPKEHPELVSLYQQLRKQWGPKCFWPPHALEQYNQLKSTQNTYAL